MHKVAFCWLSSSRHRGFAQKLFCFKSCLRKPRWDTSQPFTSEAKRIEYLFELYDKYTSGLFVGEGKKKSKKVL